MSTWHATPANDHTPRYAARGDFARPAARPVASAFRCNVCNHACDSDTALRAHYAAKHPQELARIEALTARLGHDPTLPRA